MWPYAITRWKCGSCWCDVCTYSAQLHARHFSSLIGGRRSAATRRHNAPHWRRLHPSVEVCFNLVPFCHAPLYLPLSSGDKCMMHQGNFTNWPCRSNSTLCSVDAEPKDTWFAILNAWRHPRVLILHDWLKMTKCYPKEDCSLICCWSNLVNMLTFCFFDTWTFCTSHLRCTLWCLHLAVVWDDWLPPAIIASQG